MPPTVDAHEITPGLWLGACPATPEFIRALRSEHGVTSLVSMQTDADLAGLGLSWPLLWRFLMANGISTTRVPIVDFDQRALYRGLTEAVAAIAASQRDGNVTYVHCTAGINRSPTTVIAYLVRHGGLDLDAAWELVESRRSVVPDREVLAAWLEGREL